jgi:hypothetical protein
VRNVAELPIPHCVLMSVSVVVLCPVLPWLRATPVCEVQLAVCKKGTDVSEQYAAFKRFLIFAIRSQ